jgi:alkaline phosphatase
VDIAHQLVYNEEGRKLKVILGGGRRSFINATARDDENRAGYRTDGRNLIEEWLRERNRDGKAEYIWHNQQLREVNVDETDFLLGLFEHDHLLYRLDVVAANLLHQEPMLTDMTRTAINMLKKETNGFFLLVEGGRIDHAHHSTYARKVLDETVEFARAIELAKAMTDDDETLIVVTSDHSHAFTYAGYPWRHNDILGIGGRDSYRMPYETLAYANGPGYAAAFPNGTRADITESDFTFRNRRYPSTVPLSSETHAGEDVAVYASGPYSHLFQGSYEQNAIPMLMSYAAKIGPYANEN